MQFEYGVFWGCKPYYPLRSLSMTDIKEKALRSSKRLYNSVKERNVIAEETKGQNETRTWFDVWKPPITAWQCKRCLWKPTTSPTKAVSGVLFYTKQVQTNAMWDGIESESSIIQTFENETGQKVHRSGFFVSETSILRCVSWRSQEWQPDCWSQEDWIEGRRVSWWWNMRAWNLQEKWFCASFIDGFPQRFNLLFNRSDFIFKIFWFVETFHLTSLAFSINFSLGSLVSLNCIGSVYINPGSHIRCYRLSSLFVEVVSPCFHLSAAVAISV